MKHSVTRIFAIVLAIMMLASFVGCGGCGGQDETTAPKRLKTPFNHIFNEITSCFEWTAIEHADAYLVEYEGKTYTVTETYFEVKLQGEVNEITVQAIDTTGEFESSRKVTYTYTLPPA